LEAILFVQRHRFGTLLVSNLLCVALSVSVMPLHGQEQKPAGSLVSNTAHLSGKRVTLPLAIVKGYPFLEGSVNGKAGKLLLDTGDWRAFDIDNHTVTQAGGISVGQGAFGSGQTFDVMRYPVVDELRLAGGLHFEKVTNIRGNPGLPLEQNITPDFIGWIGLDFWTGYIAKIDYEKSAVTFYRDNAAGDGKRAAEVGESVLQKISFTNKPERGVPLLAVKLGDKLMTATVDTGAHNGAWLTDADIATLKKAGTLREDGDGFIISGITINGVPIEPMHIDPIPGRPPFAKTLPDPEASLLYFGYEFLSRYKTLWDYSPNTLTLLQK
jgi:hypothetical protein